MSTIRNARAIGQAQQGPTLGFSPKRGGLSLKWGACALKRVHGVVEGVGNPSPRLLQIPFYLRTGLMLLVASILGLLPPARAEDKPKPLTFCAEPAAMPRTGKATDGSPQGLDVAVARLICKKLGRPLEIHWCASPSCSRKCLREGRCDVILGHPFDTGGPKDIAWSVPYAGSRFGLVVPREAKGVRSLTDVIGKRVGVVGGTVALPEDKYTLVRFKTRAELLDRFAADKLDAAFLDADFAAWHLHSNAKLKLRLVEDYVPREHWNMAQAVRAKDAGLLVEINKALADLAESGAIKKAYADLGVPHRAPFTGSAGRPVPIDTWKRIQERGELRIAMDPANLPYSSAKANKPGFDVELARELAKALGLKLKINWLNIHRETAMAKLLADQSDLTMGAAVDENAFEDDDELAERVIYSKPYYGTGYLLVTRTKGPQVKALAELKGDKARRLGTEAGSYADYNLRQRGYLRSLFRNQLAVLKALDDSTIDYAYLWANVGWTLHATPEFKLEIVPKYIPEDHWNIAVAMRKSDVELKKHVDAAIEKLVKDGAAAGALVRYHVPYFPPFAEKKKEGADRGIIRQPAADRGREPQMQKVQTSTPSLRGSGTGPLGRPADRGTGSEQPSLFGCPSEAGRPRLRDRSIAGRQARCFAPGFTGLIPLTIPTRRGWPPQEILRRDAGRHARRSLRQAGPLFPTLLPGQLSNGRPFRVAAPLRLDQLGDDPLAVELGVAARGLEGRNTRTYPSLEAILEAVADKQAKAGYVISTRGQWLADRRWPGQSEIPRRRRRRPLSDLCGGSEDGRRLEGSASTRPGQSWPSRASWRRCSLAGTFPMLLTRLVTFAEPIRRIV